MELVAIGAIAFVALLMFSNFGKNPTKKTDQQLKREEALHLRRLSSVTPGSSRYEKASKDYKVLKGEIERREKVQEGAKALKPANCRKMAKEGYKDGWKKARTSHKNDEKCHEIAMVSALYKGLEEEFGEKPPQTEDITGMLCLEMLPFNLVGVEKGKEAIIEYIVWKNYPEAANESLLSDVVEEARKQFLSKEGGDDFLDNLKTHNFNWIALL